MYIHLMRYDRRKEILSSNKTKTLAIIDRVYGDDSVKVLEHERYILWLRYIKEKQLKDISKELNLNIGTVLERELKGIIKIQEYYE